MYPSASWEHVILALKTVDQNYIAQTILHCLPETALSSRKQLTPHEEIIQEATLLTLSELIDYLLHCLLSVRKPLKTWLDLRKSL